LDPGDRWEGLLLAYSSFPPIPLYLVHRELCPIRLSAVDQYGRWHWSYVDVLIDRTATMRPLAIRQPGKGLFEGAMPSMSVYDAGVPNVPGAEGPEILRHTRRV